MEETLKDFARKLIGIYRDPGMDSRPDTQWGEISDVIEDMESTLGPAPKRSYVFFYCEGTGAWIPLDDADFSTDLADYETRDIQIKRMDMTEYEYLSLPDHS